MIDLIKSAGLTADLPVIASAFGSVKMIAGRLKMICPFHDEKTASMVLNKKDKWRFRCFGCGESGDAVDFVAKKNSISKRDAAQMILKKESFKSEVISFRKRKEEKSDWQEIDWQSYVDDFTTQKIRQLSSWRGYSISFCNWLKLQKIIGVSGRAFCFPITNQGKIVRAHCRVPGGRGWFYEPKLGSPTDALVIGAGKICHVFESQWDMFAAMDSVKYNLKPFDCWTATRGASNAKKLSPIAGRFEIIYLYKQADSAADKWADDIVKQLSNCIVVNAPPGFKDINDYVKSKGVVKINSKYLEFIS